MKDLQNRSDDMSELEQSMTTVKFNMNEVKENLTKVAESLTKISDDNNARDWKFDEFIKNFYTGLNERDKRTDEKIDIMERQIDAKIDEKLAGLDTRFSAIEVQRELDTDALAMHKQDGVTLQRIAKPFCMDSKLKAKNRASKPLSWSQSKPLE